MNTKSQPVHKLRTKRLRSNRRGSLDLRCSSYLSPLNLKHQVRYLSLLIFGEDIVTRLRCIVFSDSVSFQWVSVMAAVLMIKAKRWMNQHAERDDRE